MCKKMELLASLAKNSIPLLVIMIVSLLLSTQNGTTALLSAGLNGRSEVVKLLLVAGARDIRNKVHHWVTMM